MNNSVKANFVHLQVHSEYSMVDSLVRIEKLIRAVTAFNMSAVAVADLNNLFCLVKFYKEAIQAGVKPILGAELCIKNEDSYYKITALCKNLKGYRNLTKLLSNAYIKTQRPVLIHYEELLERKEGLIILADRQSEVGQALLRKQLPLAHQRASLWLNQFPNHYYLVVQRLGLEGEEELIEDMLLLSLKYTIPIIATNPVRFLQAEDFEAHEARVCIGEGTQLNNPNRRRSYTKEQYLKTPDEMAALFQDIPEALENTVEVAKRCNVILPLNEIFLPTFAVPPGQTIEYFLETRAQKELDKKLKDLNFVDLNKFTREDYEKRLERELAVINKMGYAGYFLIVADFIHWAKSKSIPVGPGRGSGAGSLVAYVLGITGIDPLPQDLLFERFLNPERVSMPDFDVDFCMEGRDRVIDYVAKQYGAHSVAQIITYGSMAARAVVRDVGRVLGLPYGFVDKIAKLIPFELGMMLKKALSEQEILKERYLKEEEVKNLIDLAQKLEGLVRNVGKHAGGVVIAPSALTDFLPLYCESDSQHVLTQFDKDDVETIGLVKFDFLGLRTLTIIDWTLKTINQDRSKEALPEICIESIPLNDAKTYALLQSCKTTAVFQLESRSMKELIKRLKPDHFNDIVPLVALMRPGPLQSGMVDTFIACKHGQQKVNYLHPALESVLKPTYGVILYQEQVMQIAQILANYSLGDADLLRRAMGKKKSSEMARHREIFIEGAKKNGITKTVAQNIFNLMEKFAGYGFNKSHSVAYALLTYQTAWLKANYPAEFMAAVLSSDMDHTDKIVRLIYACQEMQLEILPPEINQSNYRFTVTKEGKILYGLGAVKGVGGGAISHLLEARTTGPFLNLFDLCARIDIKKIGRRSFEPLIRCGAMDGWGISRATLMNTLDSALQTSEQASRNKIVGQHDLFEYPLPDNMLSSPVTYFETTEWDVNERLRGEKETLGFYVSGHPMKAYEEELKGVVTHSISQLTERVKNTVIIAGSVTRLRTILTKTNKRMAILTLEDCSGQIEITVFNKLYQNILVFLDSPHVFIVRGNIVSDEFTAGIKLIAESILTLDKLREKAKRLLIQLEENESSDVLLNELENIIKMHAGGSCPIWVSYRKEKIIRQLILGDAWRVKSNTLLLKELKTLLGENKVFLEYHA